MQNISILEVILSVGTFGTMQMSQTSLITRLPALRWALPYTTPLPAASALQMATTLVPRTIQVQLGITPMEPKDIRWVMLMEWQL